MRAAPVASITSRSKPERDAARRRHLRERVEKVAVDRILLAIAPLPLRHRLLEAPPLLLRVGQLGEAVGELDAADVKLEALRQPRVAVGLAPTPPPASG